MSLVAVSRGYQITLPAKIRKKYHIDIGTQIEIEEKENKLILSPLEPLNLGDVWKQIDKGSRVNVSPERLVKMKRELYGIR
ncbi:AbrB/MazE/SpoVT family DNA-binding domain-containing protein [Candidatus Woesearchaeota archaeon]|nr:AbrB/MazE/SpoVT family DNA-binding domain-containing protein [Candidatus Woesearchaeota archaeon]